MTTSMPIALAILLSTCSVVRSPAPMTMRTQPTNIVIKYWPVFLTVMPATNATRQELYENPKISTPAHVGDFSLHASKKTAYQSDSGRVYLAISQQSSPNCELPRTT